MVGAGGGQIIAISSVAGIAGVPLRSAYSAAKHGIIGYHDAVRAENEHLGLKVLVVAPGSVRTNVRSEEHTSELQSLMRISYAVFCLKKKTNIMQKKIDTHQLNHQPKLNSTN